MTAPRISDEAAARAAAEAGGSSVCVPGHEPIYCMEPASFRYEDGFVKGRFIHNPGLYSQHRCDRKFNSRYWGCTNCGDCGGELAWTGPPVRRFGMWVYRVVGVLRVPGHVFEFCWCRNERPRWVCSPIRLVIGGTRGWWRNELGWELSHA